eukprot:m51a1_g6029 putative ras-related protein rab-25 (2177) ;mRNA; f:109677-118926
MADTPKPTSVPPTPGVSTARAPESPGKPSSSPGRTSRGTARKTIRNMLQERAAKVDLASVLVELENRERAQLVALPFKSSQFQAPEAHISRLEYTTSQLNQINRRVGTVIRDYETVAEQDDVVQIVDSEQDGDAAQSLYDIKSILADSKGKVKVLVVDYDKLCMDREEVLKSLRQWFALASSDQMDGLLLEGEEEEDKPVAGGPDPLNLFIDDQRQAKGKLTEIYSDLLDSCQKQLRTAQQASAEAAFTMADRDSLLADKQRLQDDLASTVERVREAESRAVTFQRALEKRTEELRQARQKEETRLAELKQEMHAAGQKARERETELTGEVDQLQKRLAKMKERLDKAIVEHYSAGQQMADPNSSTQAALLEPSLDGADSVDTEEMEKCKKEAEGKVAALERQLKGQEMAFQQELETLRQKKEEEMAGKLSRQKQQYERILQKLREDNAAHIRDLENQHKKVYEQQAQRLTTAMNSRDQQLLIESLQAGFTERLQAMKDSMTRDFAQEKEEINKENLRKEIEMQKEYAAKLAQSQATWQRQYQAQAANMEEKQQNQLKDTLSQSDLSEAKYSSIIGKLNEDMARFQKMAEDAQVEVAKKDRALQAVQEKYESATREIQNLKLDVMQRSQNQRQATSAESRLSSASAAASRASSSKRTSSVDLISREEFDKQIDSMRKELENVRVKEVQRIRTQMAQERQTALQQASHSFDIEKRLWKDKMEYLVAQFRTTGKTKGMQTDAIAVGSTSRANSAAPFAPTAQGGVGTAAATGDEKPPTDEEARSAQLDINAQRIAQLKEQLSSQLAAKSETMLSLSGLHEGSGAPTDRGKLQELELTIQFLQKELALEEKRRNQLQGGGDALIADEHMPTITSAVVEMADPEVAQRLSVAEAEVARLKPFEAEVASLRAKVASLEARIANIVDQSSQEGKLFGASRDAFARASQRKIEELDAHMKIIQDEMTRGEVDPHEALMIAQRSQAEMMKELLEANDKHKDEVSRIIDSLNDKIAQLTEENERLQSGVVEKMTGTQQAEAAEDIVAQTALEGALKSEKELLAKVAFLESKLASLQEVEKAVSGRDEELKKLMEMAQKQNDEKDASPQKNVMAMEHSILVATITDLRNSLDKEREARKNDEKQFKAEVSNEKKLLTQRHDAFVKEITENFERRISGLTQALTASLEDHELISTLMKETDAKLEGAEMVHKNNVQRLQDEMAKVQAEHESELEKLKSDESNESDKMRNLLDKLRYECNILMEEESSTKPRTGKLGCICDIDSTMKCPIHNPEGFDAGLPADRQDGGATAIGTAPSRSSSLRTVMFMEPPAEGKEGTAATKTVDPQQLKDANQKVLNLQYELLQAKDTIVKQQHALAMIQNSAHKVDYEQAVMWGDYQSKIQSQQQIIQGLKQMYAEQQDKMQSAQEESGRLRAGRESLEMTIKQKDVTIDDLKQQLSQLRRQMHLQEAQNKLLANARPRGRSAGVDMGMGMANGAVPPLSALAKLVQQGAAVPASKLKQLEDAVYGFDESQLDDEGRRRRQVALELFERDRDLRQERMAAAYQNLRAKYQLRDLEERLAQLQPNDKLSRALQKMQERHQIALREWARRKEQLVEMRRRHLTLVMQAFSDFVVYNPQNNARFKHFSVIAGQAAAAGMQQPGQAQMAQPAHAPGPGSEPYEDPGVPEHFTPGMVASFGRPLSASARIQNTKHIMAPGKMAPMMAQGQSENPEMILGLCGKGLIRGQEDDGLAMVRRPQKEPKESKDEDEHWPPIKSLIQRPRSQSTDAHMSTQRKQVDLKIILVGDSGVGKTNLVSRFVGREPEPRTQSTVGVEFAQRAVDVRAHAAARVQVWDTAGQERFLSVTRAHYRGAHGALVVAAADSPASLANARWWLTELRQNTCRGPGGAECVVELVLNKSDVQARKVKTEEASEWAKDNGLLFAETSAKDSTNVEEAFMTLVRAICDRLAPPPETVQCELAFVGDAGVGKSTMLRFHPECALEHRAAPSAPGGRKPCASSLSLTVGDDGSVPGVSFRIHCVACDRADAEVLGRANAVAVVFSVGCTESFRSAESWVRQVRKAAPGAVVVLVANKCDLAGQDRYVSGEEALAWAQRCCDRPFYHETSRAAPGSVWQAVEDMCWAVRDRGHGPRAQMDREIDSGDAQSFKLSASRGFGGGGAAAAKELCSC